MALQQKTRFYLLTSARTASHLLTRILALDKQSNVLPYRPGSDGYFFLHIYRLLKGLKLYGKPVVEWSDDERRQVIESYQEGFNNMINHLEQAQKQEKIVFIKEHVSLLIEPTVLSKFFCGADAAQESPWKTKLPAIASETDTKLHSGLKTALAQNLTVLPDEFLCTWLPIFLIRHPALVIPSAQRARAELSGADIANTLEEEAFSRFHDTFHWNRILYDWYTENLKDSRSQSLSEVTWPLVLDADDIINEPGIIIRLSEIVGLDPAKLQYSWTADVDPAFVEDHSSEVLRKAAKLMCSTLIASSGVMKEKAAGDIDIDLEAKKWREEFGDKPGEMIERLVRAAMDNYEYLRARRLRLKPM